VSLLSGRIDLDEDHVLRQNMMESLRSTGAIKNDFSNIESEKIGSDSEAALARDLLNLFATIPSKIYQSDDCQLHAYVDKNGVSIFKFTVKNAPEDAVLAQSIIDEFHDELLSLTRSGLIPTLSHNDKSDSFTVKEPSDIFEMFVKIYPYLESLNKNMARVLYSTAISIYDGHDALENDYDLTTLSNGQIAIIKALRSIISTYDNTLDFTVTATDDLAENNDAREYSFDISLGRNNPRLPYGGVKLDFQFEQTGWILYFILLFSCMKKVKFQKNLCATNPD
jgi:hypothetical protein